MRRRKHFRSSVFRKNVCLLLCVRCACVFVSRKKILDTGSESILLPRLWKLSALLTNKLYLYKKLYIHKNIIWVHDHNKYKNNTYIKIQIKNCRRHDKYIRNTNKQRLYWSIEGPNSILLKRTTTKYKKKTENPSTRSFSSGKTFFFLFSFLSIIYS